FYGAFARQCPEMVFRRVGRLEAQGPGDFGTGRGKASARDFASNELEDLLLTRGKLDGHGNPDCVFIQSGLCSTLRERSSDDFGDRLGNEVDVAAIQRCDAD